MNKTLLTGNLTADARLNTVNDTTDAISFTVATNDGYTDAKGEWVDQVEFHDCSRFVDTGKGDKLVAMLTKGREVEVEGALKSAKARTGTDGKVYNNKFIRVESVKPGRKPAPKAEGEGAAE